MIYKKLQKNKLAQEEMFGFVLIIIVVAVIMLFFLGAFFNSEERVSESHEVDSFIGAFLGYTTDCKTRNDFLQVSDLIFECIDEKLCLDGRETCKVLNSTLNSIVEQSWKAGPQNPVKGYELLIASESSEIVSIKQGNATSSRKASLQNFARGSDSVDVMFRVYS